jgi:septal ring factor EnvC (AmiA/AmiB activator)
VTLVVLGLAAAAISPAAAQSDVDARLEEVERNLEEQRRREKELDAQARELSREVTALKKDLVGAARSAQDTEDELSALEGRLAELRVRETTLKAELGARDAQMAHVLAALERLALRPPEALFVQPAPPEDTVRSAILLRAAVPALRDKAETLRDELKSLAEVRRDIAAQKDKIAVTAEKLVKQKATLAALLDRKADMREATSAELRRAAERAEALSKNAAGMRDLLGKLETERKRREDEAERLATLATVKPVQVVAPKLKPPPQEKAPQKAPEKAAALPPDAWAPVALETIRGTMPMPARGAVVTRYGEPDKDGATSKGIVVRTRAGSPVVAPADGTIAFAGPYRGYGQLLIIEHGGGYHTLLSGMDRIDAIVGQRIFSGEPVGVMDSSATPMLYVELRREGQPVNPQSWLTARKG